MRDREKERQRDESNRDGLKGKKKSNRAKNYVLKANDTI